MAKIQSLPGEIIKKSNAIARAQWKPESVWEPRIVALVASKVRESDEDFQTYRIPIAELLGISDEKLSGYQYQEIKQSIAHLGKATIRIEGNKPRNFRQYNIFALCGYEDGCLIAGFHPDLKIHFLNLKAQFTSYNLFEYLKLPSSYSQRLFEIIKSWSNSSEVIILVSELHDILNTPESFRKDFRQFRIRVIEKAHKDIHENTSLRFEWEAIKQGKKIISIRFVFSKKCLLDLSNKKKIINNEKIIKKNNEKFKIYTQCYNNRGPACVGGHQKEDICEICKKFR